MPQLKKLIISTFAAAVMLLFGAVNEVNGDPLKYEVVGDTVTIKDCKETASGALAIPSIYEGKPVTSIGDWAFYGCTKLTSVTIPDSVTGIGYAAFSKCGSLKSIDVGEGNTEYSSEDGVLFDKNKTVLIHFPAGKGGHYTIPDGVTSIGDHAFIKCISLTSVTIPDSVTSIGDGAFSHCISLTSIEAGQGNTEYSSEDGVLFDKNKTRLIQFPAGKSGHYTIPQSVTTIGNEAFSWCTSLTSVAIPESVTSIGNEAFSYCSSLTSIIFEGNAPFSFHVDGFSSVSEDAKIFINPEATGFGETFARLPVIILKELKINTFSKIDSPFTISFESNSGLSYIIQITHDLKQWGEIGVVQGTGSSVEYTDWREALFQKQYYRLKLVE